MGGQHQRVDRSRLQQQSENSRRPSGMAEDSRRWQQWCPYDPDGSGAQVTCNYQYNQLQHSNIRQPRTGYYGRQQLEMRTPEDEIILYTIFLNVVDLQLIVSSIVLVL